MRILCGYIPGKLQEKTYQALVTYALENYIPVDFVDMSGSRTSYWHAIRERWTGEEDLVTVEQDNVITQDTLPSFFLCDLDWCCFAYQGPEWLPDNGLLTTSLGCTRFSARLQRRFPHEQIFGDYAAYYLIDQRFDRLFSMHGYRPHVHGKVEHLHDYNSEFTEAERNRAAIVYEMTKTKFL